MPLLLVMLAGAFLFVRWTGTPATATKPAANTNTNATAQNDGFGLGDALGYGRDLLNGLSSQQSQQQADAENPDTYDGQDAGGGGGSITGTGAGDQTGGAYDASNDPGNYDDSAWSDAGYESYADEA